MYIIMTITIVSTIRTEKTKLTSPPPRRVVNTPQTSREPLTQKHGPFLWMTSANPLQVNNFDGYTLRWHDDDALIASMKQLDKDLEKVGVEGAYSAFDSVIPWAFKADIWRYAVLWRYGGVYLDHECILVDNLQHVVETLQKDGSFQTCSDTMANGGIPKKLWQGFLVADAGEPILLRALRIAIDNVKNRRYPSDTLDFTGPGVLRQAAPKFEPSCSKKGWNGGKLVYNSNEKTFVKLRFHPVGSYHKAVKMHKVYKNMKIIDTEKAIANNCGIEFSRSGDKNYLDVKRTDKDIKMGLFENMRMLHQIEEESKVPLIIMHGSLIGWWWNRYSLPWDSDIDIVIEDIETFQQWLFKHPTTTQFKFNKYHPNNNHTFYKLKDDNFLLDHDKNVNHHIEHRLIHLPTGVYTDICLLYRSSDKVYLENE